jgi:F-type H+-transporting ATPase subunit delta
MKASKQIKRDAKGLLRVCIVQGRLDAVRVRQTVAAVIERKPRSYLALLGHFQRLVKLEAHRHAARVESATPLDAAMRDAIAASLTRRHGAGLEFSFQTNPALIGGIRVQVGSDVYQASVQDRLAALQERFGC